MPTVPNNSKIHTTTIRSIQLQWILRSKGLILFATVATLAILLFTTTNTSTMSTTKKTWKIFWDLQCPYSKKNWEHLAEIQAKFQDDYDFSIHLTSLAFHPQAFTAQCAANLIRLKRGANVQRQFIDACFIEQESFMNAAIGDARKSEIDAVFARIAEKSGALDDPSLLTREFFLANLHEWEPAVKPAWTEHKQALSVGVFSTPKHVIDGVLVEESESAWGAEEWAQKLASMK